MELTPTPHVVHRRPRTLGLVGAGLLLVSLLMAPAAFGLEQSVVRDPAMGPSLHDGLWRGSLVVGNVVPGASLHEGDVVSFHPPGVTGGGSTVTRRVVEVVGDAALTRGDDRREIDPWRIDLASGSFERVSVRLPLVGYLLRLPVLLALGGLLLVLLGLRLRRRTPAPPPLPAPETRIAAGNEV